MAMSSDQKDVIEAQVGQIDLLLAMYPSEGEITMDSSTRDTVDQIRHWCQAEGPCPSNIPTSLQLELNLDVSNEQSNTRQIQLIIELPLRIQSENQIGTISMKARLRQPQWMTKNETAVLSDALPQDDVFAAIEYIVEEAPRFAVSSNEPSLSSVCDEILQTMVRVWFYFPSLSTREKRNDLVEYAPSYDLTGFVLAGKPGILCLEGDSSMIDAYMKFIKTESWGDIPSHQKKVSERYRETPLRKRAFENMQEVTDSLGDKHGERANRGDMKALEAWLRAHGLGSAFEKVLM